MHNVNCCRRNGNRSYCHHFVIGVEFVADIKEHKHDTKYYTVYICRYPHRTCTCSPDMSKSLATLDFRASMDPELNGVISEGFLCGKLILVFADT